jgi:hypothetical protein
MTHHEIEKNLARLGKATELRVSLVDGVMRRIDQVATVNTTIVDRESPLIHWVFRIAAIGIAAAFTVAVISTMRPGTAPSSQSRIVFLPQTQPVIERIELFPTVMDYQRAYSRSPEALDALLQPRPSEADRKDELNVRGMLHPNIDFYQ